MIKLKSLLREKYNAAVDDYFYHMTLSTNIQNIKAHGLRTRRVNMTCTDWEDSKGKIFLCDLGAVKTWIIFIADWGIRVHNVPDIGIFRVKKKKTPPVHFDRSGTIDSGYDVYYVVK